MYLFCIDSLKLADDESIPDFLVKEKELYGKMDPSIRHHLQKRGLSIKENTYIGFDTEFTKSSLETNCLVSAQIAVTTKSYIKIPRVRRYQVSTVDEKTNKLIILSNNTTKFNYAKIEESIQKCIDEIRLIKYSRSDGEMLILSECLKMIKGLSYYEQDDYTTFSLPRSVIQPYIYYGNSFSLKEILEKSSTLAKKYLDESNGIIMDLIRTITKKDFSFKDGKDKLIGAIHQVFSDYSQVEAIGYGFDKPLTFKSGDIPVLAVPDDKRLTRYYLNELFSHKLCVTKMNCYYLIAHLTPADLSMLSDFNEVKEELTIVNGSFVTLGNPITYAGKSIHIRDTMLLAPGGSKSLANIGKLYSEEFNKVKINKEDLEDMQGFLFRDKEKFTEYALKDAIISLIHAS